MASSLASSPIPDAPVLLAVVTVDGPVGVGKSVLARQLAQALGWTALDTGAMYRAVAWKALAEGVMPADARGLGALAQQLDLRFEGGTAGDAQQVFVDGLDVTMALRSLQVSAATPMVARHEAVRAAMIERQRELGRRGRVVAEGRDMGTVVFPGAAVKFYLTASCAERFERRRLQMADQGQPAQDEAALMGQLIERDALDRRRTTGALRVASEAFVIDTTRFSEAHVLALMAQLARRSLGAALA